MNEIKCPESSRAYKNAINHFMAVLGIDSHETLYDASQGYFWRARGANKTAPAAAPPESLASFSAIPKVTSTPIDKVRS
jgi:hypothetical protein